MIHPKNLSPFMRSHFTLADSQCVGFPGISYLISFCCPTAVAWFIVSVVVDSVNGVLRGRPHAHVGNKILKRKSPSVTNRSSSLSLILVFVKRGIIASLNHVCPYAILANFRKAMFCSCFESVASATDDLASYHIALANFFGSSAVALANPKSSRCASDISLASERLNDQTPESLSSEVAGFSRMARHGNPPLQGCRVESSRC
jgi:hypothetical protein